MTGGNKGLRADFTFWPPPWPMMTVQNGAADLEVNTVSEADAGWLLLEFDAFYPNAEYDEKKWRPNALHSVWPTVTSAHGPRNPPLDPVMGRMITWCDQLAKGIPKEGFKLAEPKDAVPREFDLRIGTRGIKEFKDAVPNQTFHPQVRPTGSQSVTKFAPNLPLGKVVTPIAADWNQFNVINRTNAVTFRGDSRPPSELIRKYNGFQPPSLRTDDYYLENCVAPAFKSYMWRRYERDLSPQQILDVIRKAANSPEDKQLLADYTMWRLILKREESHLGRMVDEEFLKGYISTAIRIDNALRFASGKATKPGWLYVVVVHGGFVVPVDFRQETIWGSFENEIAQLGPIPAERVVGFTRVDQPKGEAAWRPVGPIFFRKKWRKKDPKACKKMYDFISGKVPELGTHEI